MYVMNISGGKTCLQDKVGINMEKRIAKFCQLFVNINEAVKKILIPMKTYNVFFLPHLSDNGPPTNAPTTVAIGNTDVTSPIWAISN